MKIDNVNQDEPSVSLDDLIIRASDLHIISEIDAFQATRMLDPKKVQSFTNQLLGFALDRVAELQREGASV